MRVKGTAWWAVQLDSGIVAFTLAYISDIVISGKIYEVLQLALMGGGGAELGKVEISTMLQNAPSPGP